MVDARVKGSKVPVSVVAPRSGVHFEVARLLRAARQGVVVRWADQIEAHRLH